MTPKDPDLTATVDDKKTGDGRVPYNIRLGPDLKAQAETIAAREYPDAGRGALAQLVRRIVREYVAAHTAESPTKAATGRPRAVAASR